MVVNNNNKGGIGVIGLLWVVLITLKLMAIIDWSWLIVVCFPLITYLGILTVCMLGILFIACCSHLWVTYRIAFLSK